MRLGIRRCGFSNETTNALNDLIFPPLTPRQDRLSEDLAVKGEAALSKGLPLDEIDGGREWTEMLAALGAAVDSVHRATPKQLFAAQTLLTQTQENKAAKQYILKLFEKEDSLSEQNWFNHGWLFHQLARAVALLSRHDARLEVALNTAAEKIGEWRKASYAQQEKNGAVLYALAFANPEVAMRHYRRVMEIDPVMHADPVVVGLQNLARGRHAPARAFLKELANSRFDDVRKRARMYLRGLPQE